MPADPFQVAKAFAVDAAGVASRLPAARRAVPARPKRPALHPRLGVQGGAVDRRTMDALSGGSVDETVRRIGRATRSQNDEFMSFVSPLSGRIKSMTRGTGATATPSHYGWSGTESSRRLARLADRSSNPVVQARASAAVQGRIGREGMSGPAPVIVHNHPGAPGQARTMPSGQDTSVLPNSQNFDFRVLSRGQQRRFAVNPAGTAEQKGTVPRTVVSRIRGGAAGTPKQRKRAIDRTVGADVGDAAIDASTLDGRMTPMAARVATGSARHRTAADPVEGRDMMASAYSSVLAAGRNDPVLSSLPPETAAELGRQARGFANTARRRRSYDDEAIRALRGGGFRVDQTMMKRADPFEVGESVQSDSRVMKGLPAKRQAGGVVRRLRRKPQPMTTKEAKAAGFDTLDVDRLQVDRLDVGNIPLDQNLSWAKRHGIIKSGDPFEVHKSVQFKDGQLYYYPKKRKRSTVGEKVGTAAATVGGVVGGNAAGGELGARSAGSSAKKVQATLARQAERVQRAAASGDDIRYINALMDSRRIYRHPTVIRAGVGGTVGAVVGGVAAYKGSKKVRERMSKKNITQTELERRRAGRQKRQGLAAAGTGATLAGAGLAAGEGAAAKETAAGLAFAADSARRSYGTTHVVGHAPRGYKGERGTGLFGLDSIRRTQRERLAGAARVGGTWAKASLKHGAKKAPLTTAGAAGVLGGLGYASVGAARGRKKESDLRRKRKVREQSMSKAADPFEVEIAKLNAAGIGNIIGAGRNVRRKGLVGASQARRKWRGLTPGQQTGAIAGGAGLAGLGVGSAMSKAAALPPGPKGAEKMARAASRAARSEKVKRVVRDASGVTRTKAQRAKDAVLGGPRRAFTEQTSDVFTTRSGRSGIVNGVRIGTRRPGNRFVAPSQRYQEFSSSGQKLSGVKRSGGGPNLSDEAKAVAGLTAGSVALGAVPVAAGVAWDKAEQRKKQKVAKRDDPFEVGKKLNPAADDVERQVVRDSKAKGAAIGGLAGLPVAGPVGAIPGAGIGYLVGRRQGEKRVVRIRQGQGTDKDKLARAKAGAKVRDRLEEAKRIEVGKSDPFEIAKGEVFRAAVYDRNLAGSSKIARKNRQVLDEKSEKVPKALGIGAAGGAAAGATAGAVLGRKYGGGRMVNMITGETVRRVAASPRQVAGYAGYGGVSGAYLGLLGAGGTAGTKARLEMQRDPRYRERPKKKR